MAKNDWSHNAYTVLNPLELAHCEAGEHEVFDEQGDQLENVPCEHKRGLYGPGQTVHLTAEGAQAFLDAGDLAPVGAENVDELLVRAAAERLGLKVSGA